MIKQFHPSHNLGTIACANFLIDSEPCLFDSNLPQPWHCPFAVCPHNISAEMQLLFARQKNIVVQQEPSAVEQEKVLKAAEKLSTRMATRGWSEIRQGQQRVRDGGSS